MSIHTRWSVCEFCQALQHSLNKAFNDIKYFTCLFLPFRHTIAKLVNMSRQLSVNSCFIGGKLASLTRPPLESKTLIGWRKPQRCDVTCHLLTIPAFYFHPECIIFPAHISQGKMRIPDNLRNLSFVVSEFILFSIINDIIAPSTCSNAGARNSSYKAALVSTYSIRRTYTTNHILFLMEQYMCKESHQTALIMGLNNVYYYNC